MERETDSYGYINEMTLKQVKVHTQALAGDLVEDIEYPLKSSFVLPKDVGLNMKLKPRLCLISRRPGP